MTENTLQTRQQSNSYQELNNFQALFFTNISKFQDYTNFEIKKFGYILINNIAKGFPNLADIISNLKGINWTGVTSPALIKALQHRFVNKYSQARIPQFIYFKNLKPEKSTEKIRKTKTGKLDFADDVKKEICEILMIDSKSYDYLKYTDKVQELGKQIVGDFYQEQKLKTKKSRKRKTT